MKRKPASGITISLILFVTLTLAFNVQPVKSEPRTWYVDDDGPADFHTIQEAINAANPGDTVYVHNGTYYETLTIAKNNLTITGENASTTIIDGSGALTVVVSVDTSNNAEISGFTIQNGVEGIELYLSNETTIRNNTFCNTTYSGITLDSSDSNIIADNTIILNNNNAISLFSSVGNSISGNIMSNNSVGFGLFDGSTDNSILGNTISYNGYCGVDVWLSGGNAIYHNNFIQNVVQVYSGGANAWDNGAEGNYWSDYNGTDFYGGPGQNETGSDGIGDTSFLVGEDNQDNYPLMGPICFFDCGTWNGAPTSVYIVSNSTVSEFQLNEAEKIISFNVAGDSGLGLCRITIPNVIVHYLWQGGYTVLVDGEEPLRVNSCTDGTYTYIYFTYLQMEHEVVIQELETVPPSISILSPGNKTYTENNVSLFFIISESTSWIGYSLDGQANIPIAGNTTLTGLSDGMHSLVVYAGDMDGNVGSSDMVYFTVDTAPPSISIVSPENKTYNTTDIALTCTVDESFSWMAYSLDRQANVTITGNTTLTGFSDGSYSLIVYAKDTAGNTGASEIVYFSVEIQPAEPFPLWIIGSILIVAGIVATSLIYFTQVKKRTERS